jgi:5-methylcytosine-specific restriction endonuclease McrA
MTPNPKPHRERLKRNSMAWKCRVLEVFTRDNFTCFWCDRQFKFEYLAPCHIKSVGAGGGDEAKNLRTGCKSCHGKEHNGEFLK